MRKATSRRVLQTIKRATRNVCIHFFLLILCPVTFTQTECRSTYTFLRGNRGENLTEKTKMRSMQSAIQIASSNEPVRETERTSLGRINEDVELYETWKLLFRMRAAEWQYLLC